MELSKNKLKYINHGHSPYFKNILTEDLGSADFLPVCFDESINKTTQNCVIDLVLRYWDNIEKKKDSQSLKDLTQKAIMLLSKQSMINSRLQNYHFLFT